MELCEDGGIHKTWEREREREVLIQNSSNYCEIWILNYSYSFFLCMRAGEGVVRVGGGESIIIHHIKTRAYQLQLAVGTFHIYFFLSKKKIHGILPSLIVKLWNVKPFPKNRRLSGSILHQNINRAFEEQTVKHQRSRHETLSSTRSKGTKTLWNVTKPCNLEPKQLSVSNHTKW